MKGLALFIAVLFTCISMQVRSAGPKSSAYFGAEGIYSDLQFNGEGGDLVGTEIFLMQGRGGHYVLFQSAQGAPDLPVLVPALVENGILKFTLPEGQGQYSGNFEARILGDRIEGRFLEGQISPSGEKIFVLRKTKSHWQ